jgi:hypothetical protein
MRSFFTTIAVVVALVASTGTAVAKPMSDVGTPDGKATGLPITTSAPEAADGGLSALTVVLLATGGAFALAGAASAGARVGRRSPLRHSGA